MKRKFIGWKTEDKVRTFYLFWLPVHKKKYKTSKSIAANSAGAGKPFLEYCAMRRQQCTNNYR